MSKDELIGLRGSFKKSRVIDLLYKTDLIDKGISNVNISMKDDMSFVMTSKDNTKVLFTVDVFDLQDDKMTLVFTIIENTDPHVLVNRIINSLRNNIDRIIIKDALGNKLGEYIGGEDSEYN